MISFRQKVLPMISEEQSDFLKCKVCQKEFPRFDQRGFRNAGFTAHQNRCVEREYLLTHPVVDQQSSPRQRFLLPAPPTSTSSSSGHKVIVINSNSSSPIIQQQHNQAHLPSLLPFVENHHSLAGANFPHLTQTVGIHYVPENAHPYVQSMNLPGQQEDEQRQQQRENVNYSLLNRVDRPSLATSSQANIQQQLPAMSVSIHEMLFPITHCEYCDPEYGLHQLSCLFLAEFLRQSGSI